MTFIVTVQSQLMWSINDFIYDFPLPCRLVKNRSSQLIAVRPAVHSLKVLQLSSDVSYHPITPYILNYSSTTRRVSSKI